MHTQSGFQAILNYETHARTSSLSPGRGEGGAKRRVRARPPSSGPSGHLLPRGEGLIITIFTTVKGTFCSMSVSICMSTR